MEKEAEDKEWIEGCKEREGCRLKAEAQFDTSKVDLIKERKNT